MSISATYRNYSSNWCTPPEWLEWIGAYLGDDWFDPCPAEWNPSMPSALDIEWRRDTYCNHPGSRGSTKVWWTKAHAEIVAGRVRRLIWCCFSVEQLRHMRPWPLSIGQAFVIMPRERVAFYRAGERANSPGNWTCFVVIDPDAELITGIKAKPPMEYELIW